MFIKVLAVVSLQLLLLQCDGELLLRQHPTEDEGYLTQLLRHGTYHQPADLKWKSELKLYQILYGGSHSPYNHFRYISWNCIKTLVIKFCFQCFHTWTTIVLNDSSKCIREESWTRFGRDGPKVFAVLLEVIITTFSLAKRTKVGRTADWY